MSGVKGIARVDFYFAKFLSVNTSTYGRPDRVYDVPVLLSFNVKPTTDKYDFSVYGERVTRMLRGVVPNTQENRDLFVEGSVAYFDGRTPTGEVANGDKANYYVVGKRAYNHSLHILFEKLGSEN